MGTSGEIHGFRRWLVLAALVGASALIVIDQTVVNVALPTIKASLGASEVQLQWVVNAYLLSLTVFLVGAGKMGDLFGPSRLLVTGMIIFVLASMLCGYAQTPYQLIFFRAVQGLGGAMLIPPLSSTICDIFPAEDRPQAIGIFAASNGVFLSLGPFLGGVVTELLSWRWIFYLNVPVGIISLLMVLRFVPVGGRRPGAMVDWWGNLTFGLGISLLTIGVMQGRQWGWTSHIIIFFLSAGVFFSALFYVIETRVKEPLIQFRDFKNRAFLGGGLGLFFASACLMQGVFGAIYLQRNLGFSPIEAGLALLPSMIPVIFGSPCAGYVVKKWGTRPTAVGGCLAMAAGLGILGNFAISEDYWQLLPGYVIFGFGVTFCLPITNAAGLSAMPPGHRGSAAGILQTMRQIGATGGMTFLSVAALYLQTGALRHALNHADGAFADVTQEDVQSLVTADDPNAWLQSKLPPELVDQATNFLNESFAFSFGWCMWFLALGALIGAWCCWVLFKNYVPFEEGAEGDFGADFPIH